MLRFKSFTVSVFIFSLLCINHSAIAQTVVSLQSVSTSILTTINANDDDFGAVLVTGTFVSKEFGINQFSQLTEITPGCTSCCTTSFDDAGDEWVKVEPEPGNLIINVPSKGGKDGISQLRIEITSSDVCFSIPNPGTFSVEQSGTIVGGTGIFADATGSITGGFVGTSLQVDTNSPIFQVFSVNSGLWTLTLND